MTLCIEDKIDAANVALKSFAPSTSIRMCPTGYIMIEWIDQSGKHSYRWSTRRGNDFYPVWYRRWGHGGTATTALSQLVRWIKGKPVLGLSSWRYWAGDTCKLLRQQGDDGKSAIEALAAAGYPDEPNCVLCGVAIGRETGCDWWSLDRVSGPCCSMRGGCKQKRDFH